MGSGRLRLFPLNTVLFPGANLNLHVFEPRYKQMISECLDGGEAFGVCLIREGDEAGDINVDPHDIGTTAEIGDVTPLPFGRYYISTTGRRRFRVARVVSREPFLLADVDYLEDDITDNADVVGELADEIHREFREYSRLLVEYSGTNAEIDVPPDPLRASYVVGDALQVADSVKQRLLEVSSTHQRLRIELDFLRRLLPQLRALLERKRSAPTVQRDAPHGGAARATQERYFGKYFSAN